MSAVRLFFNKLFVKIRRGNKAVSQSPAEDTKRTPSFIAMTVVGILLCVVLIPIFIINITITIKGAVNKDEVPTVFGVAPLIVQTGSMQPLILEGDIVFIKKTDVNALKKGDIIAYKDSASNSNGWSVVTHRIIEVFSLQNGDTAYKTKGDYNLGDDTGYITQDEVVGIYVGRVGKIGNFMMKLQEPIGMAIFIGVPVVLFIGLDVLRRYLYSRKQPITQSAAAEAELNAKNEELEAVKAELERLKAGSVYHTQNVDKSEDNKD